MTDKIKVPSPINTPGGGKVPVQVTGPTTVSGPNITVVKK